MFNLKDAANNISKKIPQELKDKGVDVFYVAVAIPCIPFCLAVGYVSLVCDEFKTIKKDINDCSIKRRARVKK